MTTREHQPQARHGFAVVGVETTGLDARRHRIIEVAVALVGVDGSLEESWSSLVRAPGGTGPVHIHGITTVDTAQAPSFADVAPRLASMLQGRVLVAHNAAFDWSFLAHEAARVGIRLPVSERLCTVSLARQLDLPTRNLKLATLADHWGILSAQSHRAAADVSTLTQVLHHCLDAAGRRHTPLPLEQCHEVAGPQWRLQRVLLRLLHGVAEKFTAPRPFPGRRTLTRVRNRHF